MKVIMSDEQPKRYGNDHYWTYLEDPFNRSEYIIWEKSEVSDELGRSSPTKLAITANKYDAKRIVDALLVYKNNDVSVLGKKELIFLDFVKANCPEPYSTIAANAILWNDKQAYNKLRNEFPVIYS